MNKTNKTKQNTMAKIWQLLTLYSRTITPPPPQISKMVSFHINVFLPKKKG